jgi:hypothetical protein
MSLSQQLAEYVRACFTGLWIESHEHPEALLEISSLCRDEGWRLVTCLAGVNGLMGSSFSTCQIGPRRMPSGKSTD